jgi:acetyl-CoA carboxylase biotin carboxyl carrier protein
MDLREIRQLIKMVESADISEFEIEEEGNKIRISKNSSTNSNSETHVIPAMMPQMQMPMPVAPAVTPVAASAETPVAVKNDNVVEVRSPMVGTFYRSAGPDSDPYTDINKTVKAGDVLCIVEAMKLMNEIETEVSGKIVEILVENAQPVEYNQALFLVEKG